MGTILRYSDSGNGVTETTAFMQCINGREPHINEFWCLGLERISLKVHLTECLEVPDGTVGEFVTNYLAENGLRINIIGKFSINDGVQFLGLSDQAWGNGLPFIANILAQVEETGWHSFNNSNKNWGGRFNDDNSIFNVAWGTSVENYHA